MVDADPTSWDGWAGRGLLEELAPAAAAPFGSLCSSAPVSEVVAAGIRITCSETVGLAGLPPTRTGAVADQVDPTVIEMARQFATDVSAVDDGLRARFGQACGRSTFETVQTIYVADLAPRVISALDALARASEPWSDALPTEVDGGAFWTGIERFLCEVHRLDALDPVLSELVRLHGARQHNCRLCKSIRSRPALLAGGDEQLFDAIDDDWSALPERSRATLALTDAMIWHPASIPDELVADVRRLFAPAEAVELVLDVMHNGANKITVALAADAANVTDGIEIYEIDHDGVAHYGLAVP